MKKLILAIGLSCSLLFLLTACGSEQPGRSGSNSSNASVSDNDNLQGAGDSATISSSEEANTSNKGIPGMKSFAIRAVLEGDPFYIPMTDGTPAPEAAGDTYFMSYVSSSSGDSGIQYDYSITQDSDDEIISASFGIMSTTASEQELLSAADLYFYAVSIIPYDTSDEDTLSAWFEETLPITTEEGNTIAVGDAIYQLYGTPGVTYWVDISRSN